MVSNGRDVTRTDADGYWQLDSATGDAIFVIKPPHWSFADGSQIPEVRNIRRQDFRRAFDDVDIAPLNFYLKRHLEPEQFDALLVADTQPADRTELSYVARDFARHFQNTTARFAIHHGDVIGDDLSLLSDYRDIVRQTGIPWHHCPGNHDMDYGAKTAAEVFKTWRAEIGPEYYAFQYAGATFIILNNVDYFGQRPYLQGGKPYRGQIGERQLQFIENVLKHVDDFEPRRSQHAHSAQQL